MSDARLTPQVPLRSTIAISLATRQQRPIRLIHQREDQMIHVSAPHELALASHVRACACDGQVILLDLRRSRYLGIGGPASQMLAQRLQDWPIAAQHSGTSLSSSATAALLHQLVSQGLVVDATTTWTRNTGTRNTDISSAFHTRPVDSIEEATSTIELDQDLGHGLTSGPGKPHRTTVRIRRSLRFVRSVATAACWIRCRSLHAIARDIARRRIQLHGSRAERKELTEADEAIEAMKPALAAYDALRPFVFTARDECLLDSLALLNFLSHEGLAPRWVLGVRTGPFAAHAWVQEGSTVLNDQHEYVRQLRPILVV
ncbi:lasso peptide biosynthesis B2 protein [Paucibacter sp. O1-1]|nr:lasso peptide biosynthesis B2 protein [Paucibacter sp. O1-1]MDA3831182.1 lasso peptide biosynthesis B2 protein [Paucibacter sp. O1-1]